MRSAGLRHSKWKGDDWFRCALPISVRRVMDLRRGPPLRTSVGPAGPDEIVAVQMLVSLVPITAVSKCSKQALPYSTTSSARAITEGGTVSPSVFAVLRLMTSRSLFACSTGRSLGLAPRSILSTYSDARVTLQTKSWP
jgi:hypothetical protein